MVESCILSLEVEDVEQGLNETEIEGRDKRIQAKRDELLELVLGRKGGDNVSYENGIKRIERILETNKHLLVYKYLKDNKIKSVLHIVKYSSKLRYKIKQQIINTIVNVGYKVFRFSKNASLNNNSHSFFFAAAKCDFECLEEIMNFFKANKLSQIYDTREGDIVLSFMVKFGDHFQENFLKCFGLLLEEGIDVERVDYYKNNVKEVIRKEMQFLERNKIGDKYVDKLKEIGRCVEEFANWGRQNLNSRIDYKYKLFQAIITEQKNLKQILTYDSINSDDGENTLLQLAIIKNNVEVIKELLSMGADPNRLVEGRNQECPLVLAAKLQRDNIFKEILMNKNIEITDSIFATFVKGIKPKFFNSLLEFENLNVDFEYNGKTPLHYAIIEKNKKAIQSLLQRGSRVDEICLQSINPKDLEDYFNSCIKFDNYKKDYEDGNFKLFLVFDSLINSYKRRSKKGTIHGSSAKSKLLVNKNSPDESLSEVAVIKHLGNFKRLKHLLDHPLVYIYIMLKWNCVLNYYYYFTIAKSIFYILISILVYSETFCYWLATPLLTVQLIIVFYNCSEFKFGFRRYTLHFILEILICICLVAIYTLNFFHSNVILMDIMNQVSAFVIIFLSLSILLTIGYHLKLSNWIAMAKKVFKSFSISLLFFMVPICAFAASFTLLDPVDEKTKESKKDNFIYKYIGKLFKTLIMVSGEVGDLKYHDIASYIISIFFTVCIAIMLLNFWIGIAVADIKEIKEQSTIVAFQQLVSYIESLERMYKFIFSNGICGNRCIPSLKSKINLKDNKKNKFHYGIEFFMNSGKQFKNNKYFENCNIPRNIVSKIKALREEDKTKSLDNVIMKLNIIEQLLQDHIIISVNVE